MPQKWLWFSNYFFIPELFHCQNFSKTIAIWNKFWLCMKLLIAARQGGFIVPYVWEIVVRKNLTNFEGCHFARFYILIWWSFPKIETTNFNSGPWCFYGFSNLLNWERYHLLHIFLIVFTLEEVRRYQQSFVVFLLENAS